ncbi:DNA-binding domain-containing protein [Aspergillus mulundensis]|uniref:HTH CENPB-type domain-containing protein n=1 Tax=Aspergillus mulundensis TaxID=1810919 RepID=A0A3D8RK19_9EURO|nr:hypothetical protein DSM5745_06916 [Aspergillus mulundensis]RDW74254.1 hypothetical protein DSM5745_06916 [Aspergillus mulundensis]
MELRSKDESAIKNALAEYMQKKADNPNVLLSEIAKIWNVDYQRLRRRVFDIGPQSERRGAGRRMDDAQEKVLLDFIEKWDDLGAPMTPQMIEGVANEILQIGFDPSDSNNSQPPTVGKNWAGRFMKKHPEFFKKKRVSKEQKRGEKENAGIILHWFGKFRNVVEAHGIQNKDIWNMDKTGFRIGQGRTLDTIFTRYPDHVPSIDSRSQRKLVTAVECVSMAGQLLPPLLILPGQVFLKDWISLTNFPNDYIIKKSKTGYTSRELNYK